jgi:hypothetical protein
VQEGLGPGAVRPKEQERARPGLHPTELDEKTYAARVGSTRRAAPPE